MNSQYLVKIIKKIFHNKNLYQKPVLFRQDNTIPDFGKNNPLELSNGLHITIKHNNYFLIAFRFFDEKLYWIRIDNGNSGKYNVVFVDLIPPFLRMKVEDNYYEWYDNNFVCITNI